MNNKKLIGRAKLLIDARCHDGPDDLLDVLNEFIQHLESEPFDVFNLLLSGNTVVDRHHMVWTYSPVEDNYTNNHGANMRINDALQGDIKPYEEPLQDGWHMVDVVENGFSGLPVEMSLRLAAGMWFDGFGKQICDRYKITNPKRIEVSGDN